MTTAVELKSAKCPSWNMLKQMWNLSKKNNFTKWGFIKQMLVQQINKDWKTYLAIDQSKLAGFSFTKKDFLYRVVVDQKYRGGGIGKLLIPKHIKRTSTNRPKIVQYYLDQGYKVTGKKGDEVLLEKKER